MANKTFYCLDISVGGILEIIESNVQRNKKLIHGEVKVMELDFLSKNWSSELLNEIENVNTILAADGWLNIFIIKLFILYLNCLIVSYL